MSVTWYYWSFGFCSVAKNYDSQIVLRCTVYRKSMALYSYFGSRVYLGHFGPQKRKSISKFQNLQCKRVCNPWVSDTLVVYLDFLPLLDFFLEYFFLVFSGGGGGCSSSSLSSSSPCPSSSSSSSSPAEPSFRLANELGPLLVVALGADSTMGVVLNLSPPHHCCLRSFHSHPQMLAFQHAKLSQDHKWKSWFKWKQFQHKQKLNPNQTHSPIVHQHVEKDVPCHAPGPYSFL